MFTKSLAALLIGFLPMMGACAEKMAVCSDVIKPLTTNDIEFPHRTDYQFLGSVTVRYSVQDDGSVANVAVVESSLQPIGRGSRDSSELETAIIDAVRSWKYPPMRTSCEEIKTFTFQSKARK
jgi:outer membrane biosynthesis protein TonB